MGPRSRESRDRGPKLYERVGRVCHDAFGAAIQAGRHRLIQRRDLCDLHKMPSIQPASRLTPTGQQMSGLLGATVGLTDERSPIHQSSESDVSVNDLQNQIRFVTSL